MATKQELLQRLNEDLAAELGTIIRYSYQASKAVGLGGNELRDMFEEEVADELRHASYLMDTIVDLGGEPTTTPQPFNKPGTLREMLKLDLEMEMADVANYTAHAKMAKELNMIELQLNLEEMAADESGHARDLRRILRGM